MSEEFDALAAVEALGRKLTPCEVEQMEAEARKAFYYAEIAAIERLRLALRGGNLADQDIDKAACTRGREILDYREAVADATYHGTPLPEPLALEPMPEPEPIIPERLPLPKGYKPPGEFVRLQAEAKAERLQARADRKAEKVRAKAEKVKPEPKPKPEPRARFPRKDAAAAGKKYYISDKQCPANHESRRYTSTGQCVACTYLLGEAVSAGRLRARTA